MGAISSTLHVKVKFRIEQGITVVRGSQQVARQYLVAAVNWKNELAYQRDLSEEVPLLQLQEPQEGRGASYAEELVKAKMLLDVDKYFQV